MGITHSKSQQIIVMVVFAILAWPWTLCAEETATAKPATPKAGQSSQSKPDHVSLPASAALENVMVASVVQERTARARQEAAQALPKGDIITYSTSTAGPGPRVMTVKVGGETAEIRTNWLWTFRLAAGGRGECKRPGEGVLVQAVTALPLPQMAVPQGTLLYRGRTGWVVLTSQEAAKELAATLTAKPTSLKGAPDILAYERRQMALSGCALLGPDARPALETLLAIVRSETRISEDLLVAVEAIGSIGDKSALPDLRKVEEKVAREAPARLQDVGSAITALGGAPSVQGKTAPK